VGGCLPFTRGVIKAKLEKLGFTRPSGLKRRGERETKLAKLGREKVEEKVLVKFIGLPNEKCPFSK
jgi:hypothetical protein